jgi:CheY-like chemotaxis protein
MAEALRVGARAKGGPDRILVVEDEAIVAMLLEDMLAELGYEVVGPVTRLDRALDLARGALIDAAGRDGNGNRNDSNAVADALRARANPVVFATGYGTQELAERVRDSPNKQKPFHRDDLERALGIAMGRGT